MIYDILLDSSYYKIAAYISACLGFVSVVAGTLICLYITDLYSKNILLGSSILILGLILSSFDNRINDHFLKYSNKILEDDLYLSFSGSLYRKAKKEEDRVLANDSQMGFKIWQEAKEENDKIIAHVDCGKLSFKHCVDRIKEKKIDIMVSYQNSKDGDAVKVSLF